MKPANSCAESCAIALQENEATAQTGQKLLAELGVNAHVSGGADHPAVAWRRSGLFNMSGNLDGPAQMVPVDLTSAVDGAMLALKALSKHPENLPENGALLLGERARLMGLSRNGRNSPGGHCRLIDTRDGRIALNLAREDDWSLLEAWLEMPTASWEDIEHAARLKPTAELIDRGIELGLAIAGDEIPEDKPWFHETSFAQSNNRGKTPLVIDLSSLWAGPLAGSLLSQMGGQVVKVESRDRPDGARYGNAKFCDLLNEKKRCAAFDFTSDDGRATLKKLISAADIVIEASRPRALRQLGIDADELVAQKTGKLWLRLTAYGVNSNRIGFGDDIGVGSGLCTIMDKTHGKPYFVGDAIADPISGIFGALAAWSKWQDGGGQIIDLSMRDTVRRAMFTPMNLKAAVADFQTTALSDSSDLYAMRKTHRKIELPGASTDEIMASLC